MKIHRLSAPYRKARETLRKFSLALLSLEDSDSITALWILSKEVPDKWNNPKITLTLLIKQFGLKQACFR